MSDRPRALPAVVVLAAAQTACERAPLVAVMGSFVPAWLLCMLGGVGCTMLVHLVFGTVSAVVLSPRVVLYPSLVAIFSCALWFLFVA